MIGILKDYKIVYTFIIYLFFLPLFLIENNSMYNNIFFSIILILILFCFTNIKNIVTRLELKKYLIYFVILHLILLFVILPSQQISLFMFFVCPIILLSIIYAKIFLNGKIKTILDERKIVYLLILFGLVLLLSTLQIKLNINFQELKPIVIYILFYNMLLTNVILYLLLKSGFSFKNLGLFYEVNLKNFSQSIILFLLGIFLLSILILMANSNQDVGSFLEMYRIFLYQFIRTGFIEELIIRGLIFFIIKKCFFANEDLLASLLISNLIFGLLHYTSIFSIFWTFLGGIFLGLIRIVDDNIYSPSILHALYNTIS